jgi:hypothetical protein
MAKFYEKMMFMFFMEGTWTTPAKLIKYFKSIKEHDFVKSPYLVIMNLKGNPSHPTVDSLVCGVS